MAARSRCSFNVQILVPAPDGSCGISTLFELAAPVRGEATFFISGGVLLAFEDGVLLGGSVAAACEFDPVSVRACVCFFLLILYTNSLSKKKIFQVEISHVDRIYHCLHPAFFSISKL